jgi:hypothetical protein
MKSYFFQYTALCLFPALLSGTLTATAQTTYKEVQLTHGNSGHTLHNTQCFSKDDQWIVFDSRNNDTQITSTSNVQMISPYNGVTKPLYQTTGQTEYGPGVGAVTFSPVADTVLFIHGINNANKEKPYSFTRRSGVAIDIKHPFVPIHMDARDIESPLTPGALRGGTHAHHWSADGRWISFTYNDYLLEQPNRPDTAIHDIRVVGVMIPGKKVVVNHADGVENFSGESFAVIVTKVTDRPRPGSDEINKAADEGWIGTNGYLKENHKKQKRALAFQGTVVDENGNNKAEVFVADLPDNLTQALPGLPLAGTPGTRPNVPAGVKQRRITYTQQGIQGPRHWLRTIPDGSLIGFLSKDSNKVVQLFVVSPNGGKIRQVTNGSESIRGSFNFSPDGKWVAYLAGNNVHIHHVFNEQSQQLTHYSPQDGKASGSVIWSNNGQMLAYNRYVTADNATFLQIFLLSKQ